MSVSPSALPANLGENLSLRVCTSVQSSTSLDKVPPDHGTDYFLLGHSLLRVRFHTTTQMSTTLPSAVELRGISQAQCMGDGDGDGDGDGPDNGDGDGDEHNGAENPRKRRR